MDRYIVCAHSSIGRSHEIKGIKCQDNCYYKVKESIIVAAIADGLSSSKHSDIASRIAVKTSVDYCIKHINHKDKEDKILGIIKKSFEQSLYQIELEAGEDDLNFYDTTVTIAVLKDEYLYYGQIGDSGIIALLQNGKFERITDTQNGVGVGKDKPVFPLAATDKWVFKRYENKISSLYLATDGVLKHLQPPLLEGCPHVLNHKYLSWIYNNLLKSETDSSLWIKEEIENLEPENVDFDDKTLVVILDKKCLKRIQNPEYYNYPSTELLEKILKRNETKLYPYRKNISQLETENKEEKNVSKLINSETLQRKSNSNKCINIQQKESIKNKNELSDFYNKFSYFLLGASFALVLYFIFIILLFL